MSVTTQTVTKALKIAVKKLRADAEGGEFAFYMLNASGEYILYIDKMPGKRAQRFQTPKLIHEHLKASKLNPEGLGSSPDFKRCKSCAGTARLDGDTIRFLITSKAGKGNYSDLDKCLQKPTIKRIVGTSATGQAEDAPVEEHQLSQDLYTQIRDSVLGSSNFQNMTTLSVGDCRRAFGRRWPNIGSLGDNIAALSEYLEKFGATMGAEEKAQFEGSLASMETFYETLQDDLESETLRDSYDLLKEEAEFEATLAEEMELKCDDLAETLGTLEDSAESVAEVSQLIGDLLNGDLPPDFVESQLAKFNPALLESKPRLQKTLNLFLAANSVFQEFTAIDISEEFRAQVTELGNAAAQSALSALVDDADGVIDPEEDSELFLNGATHASLLMSYFNGGKQAALFAGRLAQACKDLKDQPLESSVSVTADVQTTFDAYGSVAKEGNNFLEGITYLANAGFLVDGKVELTAEAKASFGPMAAKLEGMLGAYAKVGGSFDAQATIGLLSGIIMESKVELGASVQAYAEGWTTFTIGGVGEISAGGYAKAFAKAEAHASGSLVISPNGTVRISGNLGGSLKAGVETAGEVALKDSEGRNIFKLATSIEASVGLGAELGGSFNIEGGVLTVRLNIAAILGVGGAINGELEIDLKAVGEKLAEALSGRFQAIAEWVLRQLPSDGYQRLMTEVGATALSIRHELNSKVGNYFSDMQGRCDSDFIHPKELKDMARILLKSKKLVLSEHWWSSQAEAEQKVINYSKQIVKKLSKTPSDLTLYKAVFVREDESAINDFETLLRTLFLDISPCITELGLRVDIAHKTIAVTSITLDPHGGV
jgi:hypothetical protein